MTPQLFERLCASGAILCIIVILLIMTQAGPAPGVQALPAPDKVEFSQPASDGACPTWVSWVETETWTYEYVITGTTGVEKCMQPGSDYPDWL